MNTTINLETNMSPTALFYKEKEYLQPLLSKAIIDTYHTPNKYKVSSEAPNIYGSSRYSVDPMPIGEEFSHMQREFFVFNNIY